jgi:hypothetical protein
MSGSTAEQKMLRKIACIMIRMAEVEAAAYYAKVFGLRPQWSGDDSTGLKFPVTDTEIVLHNDPAIPSSVEVHYLVDDVVGNVGNATVAMILNGLGFSNRQLYLVSQYFADQHVEHLLGPGITAEMRECRLLGPTLDGLYAHDLTKLLAGIATYKRQGSPERGFRLSLRSTLSGVLR